MTQLSKTHDYESAAKIRDQIKNLDFLLAKPIGPEEYEINPNLISDKHLETITSLSQTLSVPRLHRIELYDNAHLMGESPTSAMVVAVDGQITHSLYRHFTLHGAAGDVDYMYQVLSRRLKRTDWPQPDLIVLDGGLPQLSSIKHLASSIPFIGLAKKDEIIYLPSGLSISLPKTNPGLMLLQSLRDEAHRFSRRLHHKHRSKVLK